LARDNSMASLIWVAWNKYKTVDMALPP